MQSLDDLPDGATVYIDTSIFVAHHSSHPVQGRPSTQFLKRIEAEGIRGVISALVIEETSYVLLKLKAMELLQSKKHYEILQNLKEKQIFSQCISAVDQHIEYVEHLETSGNLSVISRIPSMKYMLTLCKRYGLLMRDGIHLATLLRENLSDIATADADFERTPLLTVWTPGL
jgi:predicted nucleic acid-binding protein